MSHFTDTSYWHAAKLFESGQDTLTATPEDPLPQNEGIQILRAQLKKLNAWPESGDTFLELLMQVRGHGVTLLPTDYDWLIQVADDACNGEDIGLRYPSIFQKLLTFPDLRKKFLQMLQLRSTDI